MSEPEKSLGCVAFVGLGVMGFPMAGHLSQIAQRVQVYNRTQEVARRWIETYPGSGVLGDSPRDVAIGADVVFMCVGNDDDVRSVAYGDHGVIAGLDSGALLVDHTTASRDLAIELEQACRSKQIGFLDAPVSGGQAGADNGALTIMVGGEEDQYLRALPYLECYSKKCELMGSVGFGQLTKMVNQICIAGVLQGLAEGIHFGQSAGLDIEKVVDVISKGAAQSWQMENRALTMNQDKFDFGFAVDWMRKDLGIALETARSTNARLPLTALVDQFYADIQAQGGGRLDTSSLLRRLSS
jgi:3-hydroxyisobutyrate dehydrogenase-like beta-hydroxyacid dehydrogenase